MRPELAFAAMLLAIALAIPAAAQQASSTPMTVQPGRSFYTSETRGLLLITPSDTLKGKALPLHVMLGDKQLALQYKLEAGKRAMLPLSLDAFAEGDNALTCRLTGDGNELAATTVVLTKLPPKPNEVKIDNISHSLIVDGIPFLPVGFYCDADFERLPEDECVNGFNMISPYWSSSKARTPDEIAQIREKMDRCAAVGMKVNYHIERACMNLEGKELEDAIRPEIEAFRDHPALLAWYIADEPEGHRIPPERMYAAYKLVKQLDPYHPVAICIAALSGVSKYVDAMDILMTDNYPVPHFPLTHVASAMDRAYAGVGNTKPVWFIPQVFGGGEFWYREPTAKEVRVMTYLSLIHGATALQSFVRRPPLGNPGSPVVWNECRTLAMEVSQLAPAILSDEPAPTVTSSLEQVHARAFLDRGMLFVLAANTSNQPATVQLKLDGLVGPGNDVPALRADAIFDRRQIDVKNGVIEDIIDGTGTRVYRIPIGPMPAEDIQPDPNSLTANCSFENIVSAGSVANCYGSRAAHDAANVMLDPFVARHGRQSVRMTVPGEGSIGLIPLLMKDPQTKTTEWSNKPWPFWFAYMPGDVLKISIWAKAKDPGLTLRFSDPFIEGFPKEFPLTTEWQRYEVTGKVTVTAKRNYSALSFHLKGKGTAWFDLFEVVRVTPPGLAPALAPTPAPK